MTILDAVRDATPLSKINDPSTPLYQALTGLLDGWTADSGVTVSPDSAMRHVAVYAATSLIAQTIASLPVRIVLRDDDQRSPVRTPAHRALWSRPNPDMTRVEAMETALLSCLLHGNAYISIFRDRGGNLAEIWPLDPTRVRVGRASDGQKVFEVSGPAGVVPVTDREILHVPALTRPGQLTGMSPIGQARQAIGIGVAAEEFAARFYGQGTLIGGYITTEGDLKREQADELQRRWERANTGLRKAHRVAVLDNAAKFQQVGIPPDDAQFLETRKFQVAEIARLYRIAPHLIGDVERSTSWGTGIEEQNLGTITYTFRPWAVRFEQRFETLLGPGLQYRFVFDGLLRGKAKERFEAYAIGRQWGWLSVNRILELEDMPGIGPAGDVHLQPLNMVPAGQGGPPDGREAALGQARVEAAAALVSLGRLGPDSALTAVGLDPMKHGGLVAEALGGEE